MGKRCQVCEGPVVNGRCKCCGMPYKNDMELYHLNEDRSEHYRHASAKTKKAMEKSEIPLPDRNKAVKKTGKTSTVRVQTLSGRQNVGTQKPKVKKTTAQKRTQRQKKKESKASKIFWFFLLVLMIAAGPLAENWDTIEYRIEDFINDTLDINIDLDSLFGDSSGADGVIEDDWAEVSAVCLGIIVCEQ